MAMRQALTRYPDCKFIWYLDQDAYIMNPAQSLEDLVLQPKQMESLMIRGQPVVPPDSIIKTYGHLRGDNIDVILAQDKSGLVHNNIFIRNGEWAKFFLETWLDPLYRSYNFQKAERHALVSTAEGNPGAYITDGCNRNTLCSGTLRSCRNWLLCRSAHLPLTPSPRLVSSTRKVTL